MAVAQLAQDLGLVSLATLAPVSTKVRARASDQGQSPRLLVAVQPCFSHTPTQLLAGTGYRDEWDLQELENLGIVGYVALDRLPKDPVILQRPVPMYRPTPHFPAAGNREAR